MDGSAISGLVTALQADMDPAILLAAARGLRNEASKRKPDVIIGRGDDGVPYMQRWWLVSRRKYEFNVYLHRFLRSDDDRALHDHPWANISFLIDGEYIEHVPKFAQDPRGETIAIHRKAGDFAYREPTQAHRIELLSYPYTETGFGSKDVIQGQPIPVWTLFITGPKVREWGFWCPKGWKHWEAFTGQNERNGPVREAGVMAGGGCGEDA